MKTTAKIVTLLTASASAAAHEITQTIQTVEQTNTALAQSFGLFNDQELAESNAFCWDVTSFWCALANLLGDD